MAWTSEHWKQNDTVFDGYPVPADVTVPELTDKAHLPDRWQSDSQFYGYPHILSAVPELTDKANLPDRWRSDSQFYGYPHILNLDVIPVNLMYGTTPVKCAFLGTELIWKRRSMNKITIPE